MKSNIEMDNEIINYVKNKRNSDHYLFEEKNH
jgi:hypothetical protein